MAVGFAMNISLLRGINLGSRNRVAMDELRTVYESLGCTNVRTYIQSGNVLFESDATLSETTIEQALEERFGFKIPVVNRTRAELENALANNPYPEDSTHIVFLSGRAGETGELEMGEDKARVRGKEIYLHCPNGVRNSKFTNAFFEKRFDVTATARNWKTSKKLLDLCKKTS